MALLLSLESSVRFCSAALHKDGEQLACRLSNTERSAAAELALLAQQVMTDAGIRSDALNAVAVSAGPGSYTGLRIGSSLAKGMVSALDIPLIAVSTMLVLDRAVRNLLPNSQRFRYFCPMIDARRMEVYCQWLNENHQPVSAVQAEVVTTESFISRLTEGPVLFFGDAAEKCSKVIAHANAVFKSVEPNASSLGELAWEAWQRSEFQNSDTFEPAYLKEFVAGPKKRTLPGQPSTT